MQFSVWATGDPGNSPWNAEPLFISVVNVHMEDNSQQFVIKQNESPSPNIIGRALSLNRNTCGKQCSEGLLLSEWDRTTSCTSLSHIYTRCGEKAAICKSGQAPLPETESADTLICYFQPLELQENKFLWFKLLSVWYFVMTTQADWIINTCWPLWRSKEIMPTQF